MLGFPFLTWSWCFSWETIFVRFGVQADQDASLCRYLGRVGVVRSHNGDDNVTVRRMHNEEKEETCKT